MSSISTPYRPSSIATLQERTEYEAWLLEAVYEITDRQIAGEDIDELIYPASGGRPSMNIFEFMSLNLGDWRPAFLKVGGPLILVICFKLIDMLFEWVLNENGVTAGHQFARKIATLKTALVYPTIIETRPWLRERLVALYENLEPLRGTIIHERYFKSRLGNVNVSASKNGVVGPAVDISTNDLQSLSILIVSMLRYVEGIWNIDGFREKRIRRVLDDIAHLHRLSLLGQLQPGFINVRVYVLKSESITIDLSKVRKDVAARRPNYDMMFDLKVVAVSPDGGHATAYLVPWSQLQDPSPKLDKNLTELEVFQTVLPTDLNLPSLAEDLRKTAGEM